MLSEIVSSHLKRVALLSPNVRLGANLSPPTERPAAEAELFNEISPAANSLQDAVDELQRPRPLLVKTGAPKGAWAHIYYVSFHDPVNSLKPTEGFYPVFLMSADQKTCWLSVCLAAGSVGISGRGGWSQKRGQQLRMRAKGLGSELQLSDGWIRGPISLGLDSNYLYREQGSDRPAGRAYECGAIVSKQFNPRESRTDLRDWLVQAFIYFDQIYEWETRYIASVIPHVNEAEIRDQVSASLTGDKAESAFLSWVARQHPEWGAPVDRTDRVGLGYDFEFPTIDIRVEVKGCRTSLEDVRLTEREWEVAEELGEKFFLCLVTNLDDATGAEFSLIKNPFFALKQYAMRQTRLQISYAITRAGLRTALNRR